MVILLGLDSEFVAQEGLVATIVDMFPVFLRKGHRRIIFTGCACLLCYLVGLCMVCEVMKWFYLVITPITVLVIFIMNCISYSRLTYKFSAQHTYIYPNWAISIGWLMACSSIIMVPIFMIYAVVKRILTGGLNSLVHINPEATVANTFLPTDLLEEYNGSIDTYKGRHYPRVHSTPGVVLPQNMYAPTNTVLVPLNPDGTPVMGGPAAENDGLPGYDAAVNMEVDTEKLHPV
ncbi:hypothetical protein EB796_005459 [Bugula neritina]|uniref:Uncharacterized protein n=1 Tax=Bugula neritina TaxID=10212 RepID=A0A7J7KEI0_BUGNE|nr:hypothetical protein EB796_005459 [Bugula neritina]